MKILTVVGARPQFIKAAAVSRRILESPIAREVIVHTGQHYDAGMSDIFFDELHIPKPAFHLGFGGGSHGEMTGRMLEAIEKVLQAESPDWLLVYGDTNSTLAGALAAAKLHVPVAHVEAGLRSFNRLMPEELNRILTDHVSERLFAPTAVAVQNLRNEGLPQGKTFLVGDVMYDATLIFKTLARVPEDFVALGLDADQYVLATVHRAENTNDEHRLREILSGLSRSPKPVVLPLHPRTSERLRTLCIDIPCNVHAVSPVGYLEMTWLEMNAAAIATDSGGVQKEAYFHARPCITLRDQTEWVELVEAGWNTLVGADADRIGEALSDIDEMSRANAWAPIYGDGDAAGKIVKELEG
jgi:UDP-GlcNAc3NAcA epimerase